MRAHTIPATLLEQIHAGKAVVVAGTGLPAPPWGDALARLTAELSAEHGIEVIGVAGEDVGAGADGGADGNGAAERAMVAWLEALREACRAAGDRPAPPTGPASPRGEDIEGIARHELDDGARAVDRLTAALDADPRTAYAFDALDELLAERGDWTQLAQAYRRQIERLGETAPPAMLIDLWTRLGDIHLDHLGDTEAAIAAYRIACELAPDEVDRHEQLADLYVASGDAHRGEAIAELQRLLDRAADRVEIYKALAGLYRAEREVDKAWCVAQVLVFLGAASDAENHLYAQFRPRFVPAHRPLTDDLWQQAIIHPREDRLVGAIFSSIVRVVAASSAQPVAAFGLAPDARVDLERDPRAISRIIKYVSGVLAIEPAPMVWLQDEVVGLRIANTVGIGADHARPVPSLLVGVSGLDHTAAHERELAFAFGKRMAYLRPERFTAVAVTMLPKLEAVLAAALLAGGHPGDDRTTGGRARADAEQLAKLLRSQLPGPLLDQLGVLSARVVGRSSDGLIAAWRAATDLTANRAGFIVANDLETAAHAIATEGPTLSGMAVKDRLRDLLGYAASESYFAVRRHLGQCVHDGDASPGDPGGPRDPRGPRAHAPAG